MKIFLSAVENSADQHAAGVIRAVQEIEPGQHTFVGLGGPRSRQAGLKSLLPAESMAIMGLVEILKSLPMIFKRLKEVRAFIEKEKPDLAVLIDYPGFHFKLFHTLLRLKIPTLYFIPPKVWSWRKKRVWTLKKYVQEILCILPFEVDFYRSFGMDVTYVGNPLLDQLPLGLSRADACHRLGVSETDRILAVLLGSRRQEIVAHIPSMTKAARVFGEAHGYRSIFALPETLTDERFRDYEKQILAIYPQAKVMKGHAHEVMKAADLGLIKSGTSTLEAALLGCPHIVVYWLHPLTCFIVRHLARFQGHAGLSNLILDYRAERKPLFTELVCGNVTAEKMVSALKEILPGMELYFAQKTAIQEIQNRMKTDRSPSRNAAQAVLAWKGKRRETHSFSSLKWVVSKVWSTIHKFRKAFSRPVRLSAKVISIGNWEIGGTGKTPFVMEVIREAQKRSQKVWVLTRGYRSEWEHAGGVIMPGEKNLDPARIGDEPALIHSFFPQVPMGIGRNRVQSYRALKKQLGYEPDWVILDDGAQFLKIEKDLELILLTSRRPGEGWYREWPSRQMAKNSFLIWTKGYAQPSYLSASMKTAKTEFKLPRSSGSQILYLVSALADPQDFERAVIEAGYSVNHHAVFPDHHSWSESEVQSWRKEAQESGSKLAMSTKDFVKCRKWISEKEVLVFEPQLEWKNGRDEWLIRLSAL